MDQFNLVQNRALEAPPVLPVLGGVEEQLLDEVEPVLEDNTAGAQIDSGWVAPDWSNPATSPGPLPTFSKASVLNLLIINLRLIDYRCIFELQQSETQLHQSRVKVSA